MLGAIIMALIVAFVILFITYNKLVTSQNLAIDAWAAIREHLKERANLAVKVAAAVRPYAEHESKLFYRLNDLRVRSINVADPLTRGQIETELGFALKSVLKLAEKFSEIQSDTSYFDLCKKIQDAENQIQASRRYYNSLVQDSNAVIDTFPSNLIAKGFGFRKYQSFDLNTKEAAPSDDKQI